MSCWLVSLKANWSAVKQASVDYSLLYLVPLIAAITAKLDSLFSEIVKKDVAQKAYGDQITRHQKMLAAKDFDARTVDLNNTDAIITQLQARRA